MAKKKGTEDVRKGDFKFWSQSKGDRFIRLYDSFSAGGGCHRCPKCHQFFRTASKIPAQGCDSLLLKGVRPDSPVPAVVQVEFKSVEGGVWNLNRVSEDQGIALADSLLKGIPYVIVLDFVLEDKVVHTVITADFYTNYEKTRDTRKYKTMALAVEDLEKNGLQSFVSDNKQRNSAAEELYDHLISLI